jgi:cytochrome c-type biogenesis protein CcmH/NrfG
MPELGQLALLALLALLAGAVVAVPLVRPRGPGETAMPPDDELGTLALRHRIAVESLRDVEADRRAGSLDEAGYAEARREAEERATRTLAELEAARAGGVHQAEGAVAPGPAAEPAEPAEEAASQLELARASLVSRLGSRRIVVGVAGVLAALLVVGIFAPGPLSIANPTILDQQLAAAQQAEAARQATIARLQSQLAAKPDDPVALVALASAYLDGGTADERNRAAVLLIAAIRLDPQNQDAYRLLITAYIGAADYTDATAATDAFAAIAPASPDVAFFRGLIAYQGSGDRASAVRWFDEFLRAAPDDPRAAMVRSLRAEAAGALPGASGSSLPSPTASPAG